MPVPFISRNGGYNVQVSMQILNLLIIRGQNLI